MLDVVEDVVVELVLVSPGSVVVVVENVEVVVEVVELVELVVSDVVVVE